MKSSTTLLRMTASAAAIIYSFTITMPAFANTFYWRGVLNGHWESNASWSTIPRGPAASDTPGANDLAIFSNSGSAARIYSAISVGGILMSSAYTGSFLMGTGTLTVGSGSLRIGSGTFVGGNGAILINSGSYIQTGGIMRGIQSTFTVSGSLTIRKGSSAYIPSFSSTGTIVFGGRADQNFIVPPTQAAGPHSFTNLTIRNRGGTTLDDVVFSGALLSLSGALTVTAGNLDLGTSNATFVVDRGISIADLAQATFIADSNITNSGSITVGDAGSFTMSGATTLTMSGANVTLDTNGSVIHTLVIASATGVTLGSHLPIASSMRLNSGSSLSLGSFNLYATGATITNYGRIAQGGQKLVHTGSTFLVTNSSFAEVGDIQTGNTAYFTLTDSDGNINGAAADTLTIALALASGDTATVTLTETSSTSGIFRGNITTENTSATTGNSVLESTADTTLTATYTDGQDGLTNTDLATFTVTGTVSASTSTGGGGGGGGGGGRPAGRAAASTNDDEEEDDSSEGVDGGYGEESMSDLPSRGGDLEVTIGSKTVVLRDIPVVSWFAKYVNDVVNAGIASGYKDANGNLTGQFGPSNPVTYAEIAKMALEAAGQDEEQMSSGPANSSARGQWSEKYIALAEELGLSVYGTSLNVNTSASRGAVIQTVLEALGVPMDAASGKYSDMSTSHKHAAAIETATTLGIISGDTNADGSLKGTVRPNDPINRAEVSKIFSIVIDLGL